MGGEYNIKLTEFEPAQAVGETVYAQALDGSNQDVYSPSQTVHDNLEAQIAPVIQTGAVAPIPQSFQSAYILPTPPTQNSMSPWVKYSVFFGLGFLVFKFLRRK